MSKELEPGTTGKRGRRGNEVFWTHPSKPGIIIARAVSDKVPKLDAERKPHAVAFGSVGHLSRPLIKAIRLGFPKNSAGQKGATLFVRTNAKNGAVEGVPNDPDATISRDKKAPEEFHARIHFDRLIVGKGVLEEPSVSLTFDAESGAAMFEQEATIVEGAMNEASDRVYAVIYETVAEACIVCELRPRGESATTVISLPGKYEKDNLAIYTFATTRRGDEASNSICLQSPATNEE